MDIMPPDQSIQEHESGSSFPNDARSALERKYESLISVNTRLNRRLVSFQANKGNPVYRWFRYKEGFSQELVAYLLSQLSEKPGKLLDPFAGVGTALFAARELGWQTVGVELLPVGTFVMRARAAANCVDPERFKNAVSRVLAGEWKEYIDCQPKFRHVQITEGAFPKQTEDELNAYMTFCNRRIRDHDSRTLLLFAAYSILESTSYTRKDGQYLRWDRRSGRRNGASRFSKGVILPFEETVVQQLRRMLRDLEVLSAAPPGQAPCAACNQSAKADIQWLEGSSLTQLCGLRGNQFDFVLTSPPYCNRYDYTRTYALELVFLGCDEKTIRRLRQEMLSCTVENKTKVDYLRAFYRSHGRVALFEKAVKAFQMQVALQEVLDVLEELKRTKMLNNNGIARMVRNYFLEMSLVIHECARVMKRGAKFAMVNDNVRYAGEVIPVDLILCEFAKAAGLKVDHIWTLEKGKGNSSQQMGAHGRNELRKCVYIWSKPW